MTMKGPYIQLLSGTGRFLAIARLLNRPFAGQRAGGVPVVDLCQHVVRQGQAIDAPVTRRRERVVIRFEVLVVRLEEAIVDRVSRLIAPAWISVRSKQDAI